MSKKYKYYLVLEDGDVTGTDDVSVADAYAADGSTTVIDVVAGTHTFDGDTQPIEKADAPAPEEPEDEADEE